MTTIESGFEGSSGIKIPPTDSLGIEMFFLCQEIEYLLVELRENMARDLQEDVVSYYDL